MTLTTKGQDTRDRVLAQAREVLVKEGIDHLVMREIATACGMKLGNLQYYFKSKEDLLYAVIARESQGDIASIMAQIGEGGEPNVLLEKVVERLISRWLKDDGAAVYATLNLYQLHRESFQALYRDIYANHYAALEEVIKQIKPALSTSERRMRVHLLTALIDGALFQVVDGSGSKFLKRVSEQAISIAVA